MNIRRYILSLLLLCSCLAAMSAVAVPDVRSVVRQDDAVIESTDYYSYGSPFTTAEAYSPINTGLNSLIECTAPTSTIVKQGGTIP